MKYLHELRDINCLSDLYDSYNGVLLIKFIMTILYALQYRLDQKNLLPNF